jgi:hypothetical protein
MSEVEERYAIRVREAAENIRQAHIGVATAEATLKRTIARKMVESGEKSAAAQSRYADEDDAVFGARVDLGRAEGELAAARAQLKAVEIAFEQWRTNMANLRIERRSYGDR